MDISSSGTTTLGPAEVATLSALRRADVAQTHMNEMAARPGARPPAPAAFAHERARRPLSMRLSDSVLVRGDEEHLRRRGAEGSL